MNTASIACITFAFLAPVQACPKIRAYTLAALSSLASHRHLHGFISTLLMRADKHVVIKK
jgi:hypothetical protein